MISLDTNVLARFYCDDPSDPEAAKQRPAARRLFNSGDPLFVPLTVVLEFEWVMRGVYDAGPDDFAACLHHLLGLQQVSVENWTAVKDALGLHLQGLDFADALHWTLSAHCSRMASFDDKRFVRRMKRLKLSPPVGLP